MRKKTGNKLHTWEAALLLAVAAALLWGACTLQRQDALGQKVIRLHVIANSDSEADQALKLPGAGSGAGAGRGHPAPVGRHGGGPAASRRGAAPAAADGGGGDRRSGQPIHRQRQVGGDGVSYTGSMTALHYPPGSIWLCGWSSGREPGKTGGAWCSHPCVPLPPATFRRRPSQVAWGRRICPSSPRRTAAMSYGSGRWSFGRACASGWESTERRGRPVGGVGEKIPYGMLNLHSSEIYDT